MSGAAPPPAASAAAVSAAAPASAAPVVSPPRIKSFTLCDFRAFAGPEPVTFQLDGKNLLLYGENGAGKSSVFHALDEFFSVARPGPQARKERLLGLKNVFSGQPDTGLKISVEFDDGKPAAEWTTARHPVDIAPAADDRVKNAAYRKAILDYRSLLETNYRHGDGSVNLFDVCINVLLRDFEVLHDGKQLPLFDLWAEVLYLANVEARGRQRLGSTEKPKLLALLPAINQGLRDALAAVLPQINPMLEKMGWHDLAVTALNFAGLTYRDWGTPHFSRIESRDISVDLTFRNQIVARPQAFLNEARLSALALAIYFAGRKVCAATQQAATPRLIVLDDVLIGLDQSNRLPVIDLLADDFKDWQVILLTHDRVWFEMARAYQRRHKVDRFWAYAKIHSDDNPTKAPVVALASSSAPLDVLAEGRCFLEQGHVNAAGNYARIAVELALREFCETKKVLVAYQQLPDRTAASDLLSAAKEFSKAKADKVYDIPLAAIDMYTSILFNKLSHGGVPAVNSHEVRGALNAVDTLLFALKVVPTGMKAPGT